MNPVRAGAWFASLAAIALFGLYFTGMNRLVDVPGFIDVQEVFDGYSTRDIAQAVSLLVEDDPARLDSYIFLLTYVDCAFAVMFTLAIALITRQARWSLPGMIVALAYLASDLTENLLLLSYLNGSDNWVGADPTIPPVNWATQAKFLFIGLGLALIIMTRAWPGRRD